MLVSAPVQAELYKYRKPTGEILITTEKHSSFELIEVIGDSKKSASKGTKRTADAKESSEHVPSKGPTFPAGDRENAFDDLIREACDAYDVPFGFVKAVIRVESHFNPNAVSHAGAMGLMQLMPRTAASLNVTNAFDPRQNVFGGTKFLRILIDRYHGDINLILAAYNAGDAAVARYDGIPYPQTRGYVAKVYQWYQKYEDARRIASERSQLE